MDSLMRYDDLIELGEKISKEGNPTVGEAIQQLAAHIAATDAHVFGGLSNESIFIAALVVALAGWVLRLWIKVARLEGPVKSKRK